MNRLQIRLLGGFEARLGDQVVRSFESRKARALLGYLAYNRDDPMRREHLASLFWSERSEESARRNLRQALYNIRTALSGQDDATPLFATGQLTVQINPELECWVDVEAFRQAAETGQGENGTDVGRLVTAAQLYRGDLLAGFYLKGCPEFEEWLLATQESFRDEAITTFKTLVSSYLRRGEAHLGIRYAKRLLAIDPLSEEAHRHLMRLYLLAGRRTRALAQYERLRNLLNTELGVDPLEESTELYRSILLEEHPPPDSQGAEEPTGPLIPLVGRSATFSALEKDWQEVLEGKGCLTVLAGEPGVGKTRMVKSFLDRATAKRHALVLRGGCYPASPEIPYEPFVEILVGTFADVLPDDEEAAGRLSSGAVADFLLMASELGPLVAELLGEHAAAEKTDVDHIASSLMELFETLTLEADDLTLPLILFLEDLQWADSGSLALFERLLAWAEKRAVWLLCTLNHAELGRDHPVLKAGSDGMILLDRLPPEKVETVAEALVDLSVRPALADFLWRRSQGLPLAMAELVNYLWDEKILVPSVPGQWELRGDPEVIAPPPERLTDLIHLRVRRLPTSGRRLMALAAVLGHRFEADLLRIAGEEHLSVVETCIELALERWLIRQFPRSWSYSGRERDLVLWARGARRGSFEFAHRAVRAATLDSINPLRRQIMHREVAQALAERHQDPHSIAEQLAFHELASGEAARALPWIAASALKAHRVGALEVARHYCRQGVHAAKRLAASDDDKDGAWQDHCKLLVELESKLDQQSKAK